MCFRFEKYLCQVCFCRNDNIKKLHPTCLDLVKLSNRHRDTLYRSSADFNLASPRLDNISLVKSSNELDTIYSDFSRVCEPLIHNPSVKHKVQHHNFTTGPPTFAKARRLCPEKFYVSKAELDRTLALGKYRYPPATGSHLFTWSPRPRELGVPVVIIGPSTKLQKQTVIRYHTSKIFLLV